MVHLPANSRRVSPGYRLVIDKLPIALGSAGRTTQDSSQGHGSNLARHPMQ